MVKPRTTIFLKPTDDYEAVKSKAISFDQHCQLEFVNIGVVVEGDSPGEELLAIEDGLQIRFSRDSYQRQFELWCVFSGFVLHC